MKPSRNVFIAAILWISSVQYFIVQWVVAAAWTIPFSLRQNFISDLGNTSCAPYAGRAVCSPLHDVMNLSFVVLGISVLVGGLALAATMPRRSAAYYALVTYAITGIGTILVGFFPENTISLVHVAAAALPFTVGNVSLMVLGLSQGFGGRALRSYTFLTGAIALVALGCFQAGIHGMLGHGGMERLVAYPQTIWMIVVGLHYLKQTLTARKPN